MVIFVTPYTTVGCYVGAEISHAGSRQRVQNPSTTVSGGPTRSGDGLGRFELKSAGVKTMKRKKGVQTQNEKQPDSDRKAAQGVFLPCC
jgi:hypothetical protein